MSLADEIRAHTRRTYVEPARVRGDRTVSIRADDAHALAEFTRDIAHAPSGASSSPA